MLQAIISNKAGRSISSNEVYWRELFKASEDSLTSTIIGLLFYLPLELCWKILRDACYDQEIPTPATVLSIEYWPSWSGEGTRNSVRVEPDVFVRTPTFDLIIEAKRYDYNQQSEEQWKAEIGAYLNEYGEENKNVFVLALGGLFMEKTQTIIINGISVNVIMCKWARIAKNVQFTLNLLVQSRSLLSINASIVNILNDLLLGFRIHGYVTTDWFRDTDITQYSIKPRSVSFLLNQRPFVDPIEWKFQDFSIYFLTINPNF